VYLLGATLAGAQSKGAIRGIILDEKGVPVADAKVNAAPVDGRLPPKVVRYVLTDSEGRFAIEGLDWGRYGVFAMKEDSAYPDMSASLYSNDVFPTAVLAPENATANVQIHIGPKAGLLIGSLRNASTGAPIPATLRLSRAAAPGKWIATSLPPDFRVLIPSSTDVQVEVWAPGFQAWKYPIPVRLNPSSEIHLEISLEPSHDPDLHPSRFLVPDGYVGWVLLNYNVREAEPVPTDNNIKTFKFPASGALNTSSPGPQRGAEDEYFYYSPDGSTRSIPMNYGNGKGMIWGQHEGTRNGELAQFGFFVGTEEQYKKFQTRMTHPGPVAEQVKAMPSP